MVRVAVVYLMWPHYRKAVVAAMDRSRRIRYDFFGSGQAYTGIPHAEPEAFRHFEPLRFRSFAGRHWQSGAIRLALSSDYDALILLADPNILSTWVALAIARLRRKPVLMWGHGWRQRERPGKRLLRNLFYRLADHILVYAERAQRLGEEAGFPKGRLTPIYNSLDVAMADAIVARIEAGTLHSVDPSALFTDPAHPLVICTARLTAQCNFPLLIDAARLLGERAMPINILFVGDGPEADALKRQAAQAGVAAHFYGACFDEEEVGQLIYHADLTVSPGKIGLTAMHSLMYGTPAITHGNLDAQMPEVEAIVDGVTGAFFRQDDAADLAETIADWLQSGKDREAVRRATRHVVHDKWNPDVQAHIIEEAVISTIEAKRRAA